MHGTSTALNPHKFGDSHGFVGKHSDSWAIEEIVLLIFMKIRTLLFKVKKKGQTQKQNMHDTSTALTHTSH